MILAHEQFDTLVSTMTYQLFKGVFPCEVLCGNTESEFSPGLQLLYDVG